MEDLTVSIAQAWHDLEDNLLGEDPDYDGEPVDLPDLDAVNRMLGRLARVRRQARRDDDLAESQIAQVRVWQADRADLHERAELWLLATLRRYHEAALALDPRAKTVNFPNGALKARAGQPRWDIDPDQFLPWALALPDSTGLVRTTYSPVKDAVKEAFIVVAPLDEDSPAVTPEGESVPGVVVHAAKTSFTADTKAAE